MPGWIVWCFFIISPFAFGLYATWKRDRTREMIRIAAFFTRKYGADAQPVITPIKWNDSHDSCYFFYLHDAQFTVTSLNEFYNQRGYWHALKTTQTVCDKEYRKALKWINQFDSFMPYYVVIESPIELDGYDGNLSLHEFDFCFPDVDWYGFNPML